MFLITGRVQTNQAGGLRTQKHQAGADFTAVAKAEKSMEEVLNQSHSVRAHSRKEAVIIRRWICHDQLQSHREYP